METLKNINTEEIAYTLANALRGTEVDGQYHIKTIVIAYMIREMQKETKYNNIEDFLNNSSIKDEVRDVIKRYSFDCWNIVTDNFNRFSNDALMAFILFDDSFENAKSGYSPTPTGVIKLANKILNIKNDESVLDLCSGKGNYLVELVNEGCKADYVGVELNYTSNDIATLRASLIRENYSLIISDALDFETEKKFDKAFSNYPFMLRTPAIHENRQRVQEKFNMPKESIQKASSDWLFNATLIEKLSSRGKAVAVMTNGSAWNSTDKNIRKFFIKNGYVEAVIALPGKLFENTSIPTTMIVLSKKNEQVKLIDARELFIKERKNNVLTNENIMKIIEALDNDSDISVTKSISELEENEWTLYAGRYLEVIPEIKNGVEFGTLIKNITRGSQLKASDLDEMKSSESTNYQYLLLSNINDGIISFDVDEQYLKEMPEKFEKYCVKDNSIVLSKIGMPGFKSAVAKVERNKKLLANGNLFVIELDEEKVNPFYVQAFFASDTGVAVFKSIYTGAAISTISLEKLKKMIIPLPEIEVQNLIANKYMAAIDEIALLKRKLDKATSRMKHIYDEED